MRKRYRVTLTPDEREQLLQMVSKGTAKARRLAHARVLLQVDESDGAPALTDTGAAAAICVSARTVERVRERFVEQGLEAALRTHVPGARMYKTKLDGEQEAKLVALACSRPPEGTDHWTLRMLADRMVELKVVDGGGSLSHETVRRTLKKTCSSRTCARCGASRRSRAPSSSATWRTCWKCTSGPTTRSGRSCASTRPAVS